MLPTMYEGSNFTSLPTLVIFRVFFFFFSTVAISGNSVLSHHGFDLHFPNTENLLLGLLALCISLENYLFKIFDYFSVRIYDANCPQCSLHTLRNWNPKVFLLYYIFLYITCRNVRQHTMHTHAHTHTHTPLVYKTLLAVSQKIKHERTKWSGNSNSRYIQSQKLKAGSQADICISIFTGALST